VEIGDAVSIGPTLGMDDLAIIAAIVVIATKAAKSISVKGHSIPHDFLPVVAIFVGLLCSVGFALVDGGDVTKDDLKIGLIAALSGAGAYSGVKAMTRSDPPTIEVPIVTTSDPPPEPIEPLVVTTSVAEPVVETIAPHFDETHVADTITDATPITRSSTSTGIP
jgi:hypothetical protein